MHTVNDLHLTLSVGRIVIGEAVGLAAAASRILEHSDALVREHLRHRLGGRHLRQLATTFRRQHALMASLSDNALTAVRLASRQLAQALERSRAASHPADAARADERTATGLLHALGELERTIHRAERRMHEAGVVIARTADRADRSDAAAQACATLMRRLLRGDPP